MLQTIIAYITIGVAAGYTIYSAIKELTRKKVPDCGSSCSGCSIKNCSRYRKYAGG